MTAGAWLVIVALGIPPESPALGLREARALEVNGRLEAAAARVESLFVHFGPDKGVGAALLRIHRAAEDTKAQWDLLQRWLAIDPSNPTACDAMAQLQMRAGDPEAALKTIRGVGRRGSASAQGRMARIMTRHGFSDDALQTYFNARGAFGDDRLHAREVARLLARRGEIEAAALELVNAWDERTASSLRSELFALERQSPGRIDLPAVASIPGEGAALAARLALGRGDVQVALGHLESVEWLPPHSLAALLEAAEAYARRGGGEWATKAMERARSFLPSGPRRRNVLLRHARVMLDLGWIDAASDALEGIVAANREIKGEHAALAGRLALESGRPFDARPLLRRARDSAELLARARAEAVRDLIECHLALGEHAEAFAEAESLASAADTAPESRANALLMAAEARLHAGDSVDAARRFRSLVRVSAESAAANDALERAFLLTQLGFASAPDTAGVLEPFLGAERHRLARRHEEAAELYEKCVETLPEIRIEAALLGAESRRDSGDPLAGAALLDRIIGTLGPGPDLPRLLYSRALLLNDPEQRQDALRRLIIDHPESPAAEEARLRIEREP
ncbi:MAG: hypothetical protein CME06_16305 [Gemmatimonadetes bacterium]|nr:hypothetical protein [Gemmatimonadota bacterium]